MTDDDLRKELRLIGEAVSQIRVDLAVVRSETGRMQAFETRLDTLHRSIDGNNGTPGLKLRIDRLERTLEVQRRVFWIVAGVVATMGGKMLLDAFH